MATLIHGALPFGVNLESLLNEAKVYADVDSYQKLGTSTDTRNTFVADAVNRIIEDFLDMNPWLGNAVTELTVDGTYDYLFDLPATLRGMEIYKLRIEMDSNQTTSIPVTWIGRRRLRNYERDGDTVQTFGQQFEASLVEAGDQIRIYPAPPSGAVVVAYHGVEPAVIDKDDVATPTAVSLPELPVCSLRWAALMLASRLVEPLDKKGEAMAELLSRAADELIRVRRKINGAIGAIGERPNYDEPEIMNPYGDYHYGTA